MLRRRSQCVLREIEPASCPAGSCRSLLSEAWPLIRCFKRTDGLNTIIRRGDIGSLAVFGLRPMRRVFLRFFFRALFSLPSRIPDPYVVNAHRGTGMRPRITHPFMTTVSFKARQSARCAIDTFPVTGGGDENTEQKRDQQRTQRRLARNISPDTQRHSPPPAGAERAPPPPPPVPDCFRPP